MGSDASVWNVYVLRCCDGSLYTGMTKDLARRLSEHQAGRGGRYTRAHLPVELVAAWRFPNRSAALSAEARFKRLPRSRKLDFVRHRLPFLESPFVYTMVDACGVGDT